jgi:DNA polymerase I-like protein with 3'-5' exonuclease and polymerase domains
VALEGQKLVGFNVVSFGQVEIPLIEILAAMEMIGVRLVLPLLGVMSREFEIKMDKISEEFLA